MADCVALLCELAGRWEGTGVNHEGQSYFGTLIIDPPVNPAAVLLHFLAKGNDGTVYHQETLMAGDDNAGGWQAFSASNNMPGIMCFSLHCPAPRSLLFAFCDRNDTAKFREEITLRIESSNRISHSYGWAMPGEDMQERSSAILNRDER